MWILYFEIGFSTILAFNNYYKNMQYLHANHESLFNVQYSHLGSSFIDIKESNMIKMVVSSFNVIFSYFEYHTLTNINIV
jgi:hypothetical protein